MTFFDLIIYYKLTLRSYGQLLSLFDHPPEQGKYQKHKALRFPIINYNILLLIELISVQAKYLFDNGTTVFFAVFMSLWAVFFLGIIQRTLDITHLKFFFKISSSFRNLVLKILDTIFISNLFIQKFSTVKSKYYFHIKFGVAMTQYKTLNVRNA